MPMPTMTIPSRTWQFGCCALLCLACGLVDAVGYLSHGVFAANMTGNTVLMGIAVAQLQWLQALDRALPLAAFFFGAMLSRLLLVRFGHDARVPLGSAAALIVLALGASPEGRLALALITVAMGMQATAITRFAGITLSTVVITSTMARIAEDCADRLAGAVPGAAATAGAPSPLRLYLLTWGCYLAGAALAGLGASTRPQAAMAAAALLIVAAAWTQRAAARAAGPH
jgi:uncharacterized membrane protein YoaK (UPF0700 family)